MIYEITCYNLAGSKFEEKLPSTNDEQAKKHYQQYRLKNPDFKDWRLWKVDEDGRKELIAAKEG